MIKLDTRLEKYIQGKGLDVSPDQAIFKEGVTHFYKEPDNLYFIHSRPNTSAFGSTNSPSLEPSRAKSLTQRSGLRPEWIRGAKSREKPRIDTSPSLSTLRSVLNEMKGNGRSVSTATQTPAFMPEQLIGEKFALESFDFVYAAKIVNTTKYYRILIKEWFAALRVGGFLIIQFEPNKILDRTGLLEEIKSVLKDKVEIIEARVDTCVIKKVKSALVEGDDINRWSFGIVSGGKNNDRIEQQIKAIRGQGIAEYEIIICGTYFDRGEPDFKYIPFTEKDDKGWITKKKNIICENAKFENLMILHDRIIPLPDWFSGMKRYGNCFDALSCVVHDSLGNRRGDWFTWAGPLEIFGKIGMLDYSDWDRWVVLDGAMTIIKKSVWQKAKWDERFFWNEGEDIVFSHNLTKEGFLIRFNPYAKCRTVAWRHGEIPVYEKSNQRLGRRHGTPLRRGVWFVKDSLRKVGIKV